MILRNKKIFTVTFPNALGGVASFNRNILKYFDRSLVFVRVILISVKEVKRDEIQEGFNCDELLHFKYSKYDNLFFVLKKLGFLIGEDTDFVLTDNEITLDSLSLSKSKAIIHYLNHDFFYVKQALNRSSNFDYCIAHSQFFNDCLASSDFNSFENKLIFLPFGVKVIDTISKSRNERLKLVFLGRFDYSKGILSIFDIDRELKIRHIDVDWLIIGDGPLKEQVYNQWNGKNNVVFQHPSSTIEVYDLLQKQDILVFPSLFEGTPVTIFEAIACGCVPIVYNIPGGIREYLNDEFSIKVGSKDIDALIENILSLHHDREKLAKMQNAALQFSKISLDQSKLNKKYFDFIYGSNNTNRISSNILPKLGLLDKKIVPNALSVLLKITKERFKNMINIF
jgi:glycosyltransferase involved in cell wall biosynthesis